MANVIRATFRFLQMRRAPETDQIRFYQLGRVGQDVRLTGRIDFGSEPFLIELGSHVTISNRVSFVTHDGGVRVLRDRHPDLHVYGPITVGSHVFIGMNTMILPNVVIGDRCVIGAGSIVTRDIPAGSIAVGAPCRVIGSIEDYEQRSLARQFSWPVGKYDENWRAALVRRFRPDASH